MRQEREAARAWKSFRIYPVGTGESWKALEQAGVMVRAVFR